MQRILMFKEKAVDRVEREQRRIKKINRYDA
jgi:hypothetical protein